MSTHCEIFERHSAWFSSFFFGGERGYLKAIYFCCSLDWLFSGMEKSICRYQFANQRFLLRGKSRFNIAVCYGTKIGSFMDEIAFPLLFSQLYLNEEKDCSFVDSSNCACRRHFDFISSSHKISILVNELKREKEFHPRFTFKRWCIICLHFFLPVL